MNKIELYGHITKEGNPMISGNERFQSFFKLNNGKQFIIEISAFEKGTINHHVWYIIKMIIPAIIKGNAEQGSILTYKEAYDEIIENCPIFHKNQKQRYNIFDIEHWEVIEGTEMSTYELEIAIEWLHIYCLENFDIAIGNYKQL